MAATSTAAACLLAVVVIDECSSSTHMHGALTDREFKTAVTIARAEADKESATLTSATATVGAGTETQPNAGPACTSGTLLHIKLIGTFPTVVADLAGGASVSTLLITADPESGTPCLIAVQTGLTTLDPDATVLFTH